MVSKIKTDVLETAVGGPVQLAGQSAAKVWVSLNGTGAIFLHGSFNVSNIVDNGTGDYTINFANSLASTGYATSGEASFDNGASWGRALNTMSYNVGNTHIQAFDTTNGVGADLPRVSQAIHGDLA